MATGKKFREVKIEVEKVRIVSNLKKSTSDCENCEQQADFISLSSAVQIFATTESNIAQLAKEKIIHFKLTTQNEILICLPSILIAKDLF